MSALVIFCIVYSITVFKAKSLASLPPVYVPPMCFVRSRRLVKTVG